MIKFQVQGSRFKVAASLAWLLVSACACQASWVTNWFGEGNGATNTITVNFKPTGTPFLLPNSQTIISYAFSVTAANGVLMWPKSPYWCELDFQMSQADTVQLFSTNIVSTNVPVAGTYQLKLNVTANSVSIVSQ